MHKQLLPIIALIAMPLIGTQASHAQEDTTAGHTVEWSEIAKREGTAVFDGDPQEFKGTSAHIFLGANLLLNAKPTDGNNEDGMPINWAWDLTGVYFYNEAGDGYKLPESQWSQVANLVPDPALPRKADLILPTVDYVHLNYTFIAKIKVTASQLQTEHHPNGWKAPKEDFVTFEDPGIPGGGGGGGGVIQTLKAPAPILG